MASSGTSLARLLPAPSGSNIYSDWQAVEDEHLRSERRQPPSSAVAIAGSQGRSVAPPYGQRAGFVPRSQADFGDGGAFPEIHIAQYPLGLGRPSSSGGGEKSNALTLKVDGQGKVAYDAIARQGHTKDKIVYSKFTDLLPLELTEENEDDLRRPDDEAIQAATESTKNALEELTSSKISSAMPVRAAEKAAPAKYIRYTPAQQGQQFGAGSEQRIIRMVEAQVDPMEPAKFKINSKVPRGPPSPPAPVLHSPPRKVTAKQQQDWKIPPCISNWKNQKGYTIPLDKRLAADGRGLQQIHINEGFAKLAESLTIADRKAREAVEARSQLERKLAAKKKEENENKLRQLAQKAREERAGLRPAAAASATAAAGAMNAGFGDVDGGAGDKAERDNLRQERHRERHRQRNINANKREGGGVRERDISEQIALGMPSRGAGGAAGGGESGGLYDSRLFNRSSGIGSGFEDDESYGNVYSESWRKDGAAIGSNIYRPTRAAIEEQVSASDTLDQLRSTNRFVPDKGFDGATEGVRSSGAPVQFEKEEDPFGLDQFLDTAKRASGKRASGGAGGAQDGANPSGDSGRKKRRDY